MAHLRNTLLLGATCVSLALSSAAFAEPASKMTSIPTATADVGMTASGHKAKHKAAHTAHKAKLDAKKFDAVK